MDLSLCGRVNCGKPTVGVLLIAPNDCRAWLVDIGHESAPEGIPLCAAHADRITVPIGWQITDERVPKPVRRRRSRRKNTDTAKQAPAKQTPAESAATSPDPVVVPKKSPPKKSPPKEATPVDKAPPATQVPDKPAPSEAPAPLFEAAAPSSEVSPAPVEPPPEVSPAPVEPPPPLAPDAAPTRLSVVPNEPETKSAEPGADASEAPTSVANAPQPPAGPGPSDYQAPTNHAEEHETAVPRRVRAADPEHHDPAEGATSDYRYEDGGQGALWPSPAQRDIDIDTDERTPLLRRAFRAALDD